MSESNPQCPYCRQPFTDQNVLSYETQTPPMSQTSNADAGSGTFFYSQPDVDVEANNDSSDEQ